jgi:hypothetical protein
VTYPGKSHSDCLAEEHVEVISQREEGPNYFIRRPYQIGIVLLVLGKCNLDTKFGFSTFLSSKESYWRPHAVPLLTSPVFMCDPFPKGTSYPAPVLTWGCE